MVLQISKKGIGLRKEKGCGLFSAKRVMMCTWYTKHTPPRGVPSAATTALRVDDMVSALRSGQSLTPSRSSGAT